MTGLLGWELRRTARNPLLWLILGVLAASFVWGAHNGASLHRAQTQAQARTLKAEAAHRADVARRTLRAAQPAVPGDRPLPAWQDPTDISNFSHYFVYRHALKPHLPLSALSVGGSALWPSRLQIAINTPFGFAPAYDFEPPRGLALGSFDLGFAIVVLLPVALILIFGLLVTFERDHGAMRLVAAQGLTPRRWLAVRIGAILTWTLPAVLLAIVLALALAGAPLAAALPTLAAALALVAAYVLFWVGLAAIVLARLPGAAGALGALAGLWAALVIGLPMLANLALTVLSPAPSAVRYVDAERRVAHDLVVHRDAVVAAAFARDPSLKDHTDRIPTISHSARLSFLTPETERRLGPLHAAAEAHRDRLDRLSTVAGFVVPPLGVESALAGLAGTDAVRHRDFERQARAYQQRLRAVLWCRVQADIPVPKVTPTPTYGRMNFTQHRIVPAYAYRPTSARAPIAAALTTAAALALLAALLVIVGFARTRRWPSDI